MKSEEWGVKSGENFRFLRTPHSSLSTASPVSPETLPAAQLAMLILPRQLVPVDLLAAKPAAAQLANVVLETVARLADRVELGDLRAGPLGTSAQNVQDKSPGKPGEPPKKCWRFRRLAASLADQVRRVVCAPLMPALRATQLIDADLFVLAIRHGDAWIVMVSGSVPLHQSSQSSEPTTFVRVTGSVTAHSASPNAIGVDR